MKTYEYLLRLPADQLEEGIIVSLVDTLGRTDLIETAIAGAHADATRNRAQYADELAAVEIELVKTNETIDRYLNAFDLRYSGCDQQSFGSCC